MQASDAYLHHVLRTTLMSLDILEQHAVINPSDTGSIRSKLQATLAVAPGGPAPSVAVIPFAHAQQQQQMVPPSLPPRQMSGQPTGDAGLDKAVALWDYGGTAPDDLHFKKGDLIVITKEVNAEWYEGHLQNKPSARGLFPHNYVRRVPANSSPYSSSPLISAPSPPNMNEKSSFTPHPPPPMPMYSHTPPPGPPQAWQPGPPPPSMMYNAPPPPQHPQQVFPYNPPPPPQQQQPAQPPAAPEKKPSPFGKVGGQLGNSFVNGAGFGAGAAIGGEIVHAIF